MPSHAISKTGVASLILSLLLACGGGGGSSNGTEVAGGGVGGTGISSGPITGFGSIVVNDVHFDVTGATITLNGDAATEGDLRLGQVVTVEFTGDTSTGTAVASAVNFDRVLEGPVEAVELDAGTVTILGQIVKVDLLIASDDESGTPIELVAINPDDILEVSGQWDADGVLHATRIERQEIGPGPAEPVEVEGELQGLDTTTQTFVIGELTVNYGDVTPNGYITDGARVEVQGTLGITGELLASEVEVKDDPNPVVGSPEGTEVEIEGFITDFSAFDSSREFEINGLRVRVDDETDFEGEADETDLGLNVQVEVEGIIDADGVLIADEIELES